MNNAKNLQEVFSGRIFRVPDYQRGYAWGVRECTDLIEDLEFLAPGREHFTGTLVLHQIGADGAVTDSGGRSHTAFHVVDGQQRLTSVVLLLDAICRELRPIDGFKDLADGLRRDYVVTTDMNREVLPKLTLNTDCRDYFRDTILELKPAVTGPSIRSHELLAQAKVLFADYLHRKQSALGPGYYSWLVELRGRITKQLTVLVHELGAEADAGVVFETTNNRGTDLNELDKVKNYLLYLASKLDVPSEHDLALAVNATWSHIYQRLMAAGLNKPADEDQLLRAHWLMRYDYQPRNWHQSRSVKAKFNLKDYQGRHMELLADLRSYVDTLKNASTAFCEVHSPAAHDSFSAFDGGTEQRNRIVHAAEKLPRVDAIASFLPLLLAIRLRTPSDGERYLEAVEFCEKYAFRVFRWMRLPAQAGRNALFKLAYDYYRGIRSFADVSDEIRRLLLAYCPDTKFIARFQAIGDDWYNWKGLKYFLYEFEEHCANGQPVRMPWEFAEQKPNTVEHILPQHPPATGYWADRFNDDMRKLYTDDIGNLCLTFDNSWLSNKPFPDKLGNGRQDDKGYSNSKLFSEHRLARYGQWTKTELLERRAEIEAWAVVRWQVPVPAAKTVSTDGLQRIQELAYENGVGEWLERLIDAAARHSIHLRPYGSCVVFGSPEDARRALFSVWPRLSVLNVWIWDEKTFSLRDRYLEILGPQREVKMVGADVDKFIAGLDTVFSAPAAVTA